VSSPKTVNGSLKLTSLLNTGDIIARFHLWEKEENDCRLGGADPSANLEDLVASLFHSLRNEEPLNQQFGRDCNLVLSKLFH
jgi:hypothetical protein